MTLPATGQLFDSNDVDLLAHAVSLIPNLTESAYFAKIIRDNSQYPIDKQEDLLPFFGPNQAIAVQGRQITFDDLKQYMPPVFFPIRDEHDFLCKLLIAFQRGDIVHYFENYRLSSFTAMEQHEGHEITRIPTPTVTFTRNV